MFVGPTVFQIRQDVVSDFSSTEVYPYDQLTFGAGMSANRQVTKIGVGGGADVAFFFTRVIGLGGTVHFATAKVAIGTSGEANVGGLRAGAGLHLRF